MRYFIGIDGGGSKTQFVCADENGIIHAQNSAKGTYYRQDGIDSVVETLKEGILAVAGDVPTSLILGVCFGMPGYGENETEDAEAVNCIEKTLNLPIHFENDVAVGWSGSLAFEPGINIVAGTGSMAHGCNAKGESARSGGWSESFSDEGSCYWLGRRTLELFSKQSDGRVARSRLYEKIRSHFSLENDFALIGIAEKQIIGYRERMAALQRILFEAATEGDTSAAALYNEAAAELALMVCAVARRLDFTQKTVRVSYSGGLFQTGDLILKPFAAELAKSIEVLLCPPALTPAEGALLLAADAFAPDKLDVLRQGLLSQHMTLRLNRMSIRRENNEFDL